MLIYLLDDDSIELSIWSVYCSNQSDIKCIPFDDADLFMEYIAYIQPDAAVIDFVMPFLPGTEVCKWVLDNCPNIKTFINTGLTGGEFEILATSCHATYLSKMLPISERLEVIRNGCKS
jgi:DNA-binding response OmpR family regulator